MTKDNEHIHGLAKTFACFYLTKIKKRKCEIKQKNKSEKLENIKNGISWNRQKGDVRRWLLDGWWEASNTNDIKNHNKCEKMIFNKKFNPFGTCVTVVRK